MCQCASKAAPMPSRQSHSACLRMLLDLVSNGRLREQKEELRRSFARHDDRYLKIHINVGERPCAYAPRRPSPLERRLIMNWDQIEGKWKEFSAKVQAEWGKLTE